MGRDVKGGRRKGLAAAQEPRLARGRRPGANSPRSSGHPAPRWSALTGLDAAAALRCGHLDPARGASRATGIRETALETPWAK